MHLIPPYRTTESLLQSCHDVRDSLRQSLIRTEVSNAVDDALHAAHLFDLRGALERVS